MFTVGSKDYSRMAYNYLVNNSLLTSHCKYVCNICLKYASGSLNKENDNIDSSNEVLSDENNEKISNELEESIISSIEGLLKKLDRTKNLEKSNFDFIFERNCFKESLQPISLSCHCGSHLPP